MTRLTHPFPGRVLLALSGCALLGLAGCASGARSRADEATLNDCRMQSEAIQERQNRGAYYNTPSSGTPFNGPSLPSSSIDRMGEMHNYYSGVDSCVRGSSANLRDTAASPAIPAPVPGPPPAATR